MNAIMKKILAVVVLLAIGVGAAVTHQQPGVAKASVDSWSQHNEQVIPFSQSVTLGTTAVIATAVTGTSFNVRAITITNSASGVVRLYKTSDNSVGANMIGAFAVIANTPLVLDENVLGQGLRTTLGKGLYVDAATGTLSITARIRNDQTN